MGERLLERLARLAQPGLLHGRLRPALQEQRPLRVAFGGELERAGEVLLCEIHVQAERPLARQAQIPRGPWLQRFCVGETRGLDKVERAQVVVCEHVGQVLRALACLPFDPGGRRPMAVGAGSARDLPVTDVAHERVPEPVFGLAHHRRAAARPDELLAGQLVQGELHLARLAAAHLRQGTSPEHLPHHGGVLQQALLLGR